MDDVDFDLQVVIVLGKGRRPRSVPFGINTGQALERYLRMRSRHVRASSQALWLGPKGQLTDSGITQMLRRRCKQAGIEKLHPHRALHRDPACGPARFIYQELLRTALTLDTGPPHGWAGIQCCHHPPFERRKRNESRVLS